MVANKKEAEKLSRRIVAEARKANALILKVNKECAALIESCLKENALVPRVVRLVNKVTKLNVEYADLLKDLSLA